MMLYKTIYNSNTKIWSGPKETPLYHPNVTIGSVLLYALRNYPNKIVQISDDTGEKLTGKEMEIKATKVAKKLLKMGYTHKDVIGILSKNDKNIAPVIIGCLSIGAAVNPLDVRMPKGEISELYRVTKPSLIFCESELVETVKEALFAIKLTAKIVTIYKKVDGYNFIEEFFQESNKSDEELFLPPIIEDGIKQPGLILCSSGTTGPSKCIILSHAAVLYRFNQFIQYDHDDIYLCFISIYWLSAIASIISGTLATVTRIITRDNFSPEHMFKLIQKYKITSLASAPYQMGLALQCPDFNSADLSTVRKFNVGGGLVSEFHQNEMNKKLENGILCVLYGMTEICGVLSSNENKKLWSVGKLVQNSEIMIIDVDGNALGPDKDGEILIRIQFPFLGYAGNPDATANAIDSDNWIHSGDIGHFDQDGFLFIVDRKKDIMKYMGYHISPSQIEEMIQRRFKIASVCVVGIQPDPNMPEYLPAVVIIRPEGFTFTEEDVYNAVADSLPDWMKLRGGVYFVDTLPTSKSDKIQRRKVCEIAKYLFDENRKEKINHKLR